MNLEKQKEKPELLRYRIIQKRGLINAHTQIIVEGGKIPSECIDTSAIGIRR